MASSIFSPIRGAFQGIVPSLAETVTGATSATSSSTRAPSSPGFIPQINTVTGNANNEAHIGTSRHNSTSSIRHISGHARSRSDVSSRHHSRQSSAVEIDLGNDIEPALSTAGSSHQENSGGSRNDNVEFLGTITWVERAIPFMLLLLARIMWDHRLG